MLFYWENVGIVNEVEGKMSFKISVLNRGLITLIIEFFITVIKVLA